MLFNLRDYIVIFENIVPKELCDDILKEYSDDSDWLNTTVGVDSSLDRETRRCDSINITDQFIIGKNPNVRKELDDKLFLCAGEAIRKYNGKFYHASIQGDSGYVLLRYNVDEFYKEHTDHFLQHPRSVSCSFALNDDYEGGEWGFFSRELTFRVPKGSAIMFPSNFLYPHEIMPVTKGIRYSIVTWFI